MSRAVEFFHHSVEWQVVICKECRYAIWPDQIKGHLQGKQHRTPGKEAGAIAEEVQQWPGVVRYSSEFEVPIRIDQPITELPLYKDGLMCQLEPGHCSYICRDPKSIREHWRRQHAWSVRKRRGGSGPDKKAAVRRRLRQGAKTVHCQRFFPSRHGSSYFEVQQPEAAIAQQVHSGTREAAWARAWEQATEYWDQIQNEANSKIRKGETDEASPWLKRTGWVEYLQDCDRQDLLQSIREPNANDDDEEEPIEGAIWEAMGEVAAISQTTVEQSGVMLRLEAIRTEMHQTRYHPLQPYQDVSEIKRRCRPWQQMLMFFVRTQRQHEWKSPSYRFNRRQFAAFERLIAAAEKITSGEESDAESDEECESDVGSEVGSRAEAAHNAASEPIPRQSLDEIHKACLAFCVELLNQRIHNREYDMALVCASAVLGVHPTQGGFRDPESYPPILSAIIKVAHFMVVQQAEQLTRPINDSEFFSPCNSPCDFEDSGYESNDGSDDNNQHRRKRQRRHQSSFEWVCKMMNDFMVRGTGSPIQWILDLRTYGLKIHYNTTAVGHVNWKDKYVLEYKTLRFSMAQFREMVHNLTTATRKALFEDLLFVDSREEIPSIPWEALHDDPTNGEVGWNFIHDQRSTLPVNGRDWLYQRIQSQAKLRDRFVRTDAVGGVDRERMRDYMRQVARFRGLLLILMHITGGQPARGTEILSVRHRNTAQGGHRNLFIEDGMVVFVTKYHKGYQMSGDVKIIHRYLPREVGELVIWYLWLALGFIQRMEAMVWQKRIMSDHMWPADADGRKWTTDRMKEELQQVSMAALGKPMHVAAYREIAIAISRQWVRGATAFQTDEADENEEWRKENMLSDVADDQATHSPHIAGMIYARDSMEMSGATADRRRQFRAVSTDWHRFLGFESTRVKDEKVDLKRKRCRFEDDADEERVERRIRLQRMNATAELQRMMQKEVSFRSVQGEAMEAIQKGESPIVAVMPTGAGKSVLFMLPAWVEPGGVTIVVVPLKALKKDMIHRCEMIGIRCAVWDGRSQPDGASIVLVTPEKAMSEEFGTFVNRIRQTRRLDRMVIDEGHVVLNDQLDFRKHLQELGGLASAETQMILLTATLPPTEEDKLFERMYWRREEVHMIRASTVRRNIQYSVVDGGATPSDRDDHLEEIVGEVLRDAGQPEGKVVIMCESKPKVREIVEAGLFPCEMFHADLPEATKEETLNEFRAGNVRVIVATGAFGMGIDIPDIRLIIHTDNPRSMMDYGQASGRAGRDGLPSRAVIIRGGLEFDDELIKQYMNTGREQCRRIDMDKYLDGNGERQQCQEEELFCDICEGQMQEKEITQVPATQVSEITQAFGQVTQEPGITQVPATQASVRVTQVPATQGPEITQASSQVTQAPGRINQEATITQVQLQAEVERSQMRREIEVQDQRRQTPEARRVQQVRTGAVIQQEVRQRLEGWKGVCVICHQAGRASHHSISRCKQSDSKAAETERQIVQRRIVFVGKVACYKCGVPRAMCDRWTADGQFMREGEGCQFFGVLIGVVYGIKHGYPEIWKDWLRRVMGQTTERVDKDEVIERFLARPVNENGFASSELLQAFMWMTKRIEVGERTER